MSVLSLLSKIFLLFYFQLVKGAFYFSNREGAHVGVTQRRFDVVVAQ